MTRGSEGAIIARLAELGFTYTPAELAHPVHQLLAASAFGNRVDVSGQVAKVGDEAYRGWVGAEITVDQAERAAVLCAFNALCALGAVVDLGRIIRVHFSRYFVNVEPTAAREIAPFISDIADSGARFLRDVLGVLDDPDALREHSRGLGGRTAVGVVATPHGFAVEAEISVIYN